MARTCRRSRAARSPHGVFKTMVDNISNSVAPPTVVNGVYTLQGNQINAMTRLNPTQAGASPMIQPMTSGFGTYPTQIQMSKMQMGPMAMTSTPVTSTTAVTQVITQANITVAGRQTSMGSLCCALLTVILGVCLIFPLCFMCCMWWRKIVYPKYEMTVQFYRAIGGFLRRERRCTMLNLTVVDNAFNAERARMLYDSISGTSLTGFTFKNLALPCNHNQKQADSFITIMAPFKELPFPTQMSWDEMIL